MSNQEDFNMALGRRLMILRQSKQVSQEYLGSCIGVRGQQIHKYETGENKITPERLMRCAMILGAPVGYFYGEGESKIANQNYDRAAMHAAAAFTQLPRDIRQGIYDLTKAINNRIQNG